MGIDLGQEASGGSPLASVLRQSCEACRDVKRAEHGRQALAGAPHACSRCSRKHRGEMKIVRVCDPAVPDAEAVSDGASPAALFREHLQFHTRLRGGLKIWKKSNHNHVIVSD